MTGTDVAPAAVTKARKRASEADVQVAFVVDDVMASALEGPFELVIDRGCFHVFEPERRPAYVQTVSRLIPPGGLLLLKTFSHLEPGDRGPQRVHPNDVGACFSQAFEVVSVEDCVYQGNNDPLPRALFFVLRRL